MITRTVGKTFIACYLTVSTIIAADFTWNGSVSSSWQEPANWTPAGVPGATDSVTVPGGKRSLEVTSSWEVATFNLVGGTIIGSGTLTANTAFVWSGGALSGSGNLLIPVGAALTLTGTSSKDLVGWTVEVSGSARWEGAGDISSAQGATVNVQPTGLFEISSDANLYFT